jgi:hypothetical protein
MPPKTGPADPAAPFTLTIHDDTGLGELRFESGDRFTQDGEGDVVERDGVPRYVVMWYPPKIVSTIGIVDARAWLPAELIIGERDPVVQYREALDEAIVHWGPQADIAGGVNWDNWLQFLERADGVLLGIGIRDASQHATSDFLELCREYTI